MAAGVWAGLLAGALALPASCGLPRDVDGTLDAVRGGTLQVAVAAPLTPAESAVLDRLARDLGATLAPVPAELHAAVAELSAHQRDGVRVVVVAGSIPEDSPLAEGVAATRPIGRERFVLLLPPGENALLMAADRAVGEAEDARRAAQGAAQGATP